MVKNDWGLWSGKASPRKGHLRNSPGDVASYMDIKYLVCMKKSNFQSYALEDSTQVLIRIHLSQTLVCSLIVISTVLGN